MADLSRERRKELTEALVWGSGMEHLAAMVAGWLAAEREAGAADLRTRVEALIPAFEADYGIQSSPVARLRAALNGGE